MKKEKNIMTVYTTRKGVIKDAVLQKVGKIQAHLVAMPELEKTVVTDHPLADDPDREKFSKVCEHFTLSRTAKRASLVKRKKK